MSNKKPNTNGALCSREYRGLSALSTRPFPVLTAGVVVVKERIEKIYALLLGAPCGCRTHALGLEGRCSTVELIAQMPDRCGSVRTHPIGARKNIGDTYGGEAGLPPASHELSQYSYNTIL